MVSGRSGGEARQAGNGGYEEHKLAEDQAAGGAQP